MNTSACVCVFKRTTGNSGEFASISILIIYSKPTVKGDKTGMKVSPRQWFSDKVVAAGAAGRRGLSSARCHFHPHKPPSLAARRPPFVSPVNQPSGIIAYITMSWTCDGLKPQRRDVRTGGLVWCGGGKSKIVRVRLPGHFSRRPGTPQLIRLRQTGREERRPHGYLTATPPPPTPLSPYTPNRRTIDITDLECRPSRSCSPPTRTHYPSGETRTFKTVSSTLADSLDHYYFNPFLGTTAASEPSRHLFLPHFHSVVTAVDFTDNPPV